MRATVALAAVCLGFGSVTSAQSNPGADAASDGAKLDEVVVTATHQGGFLFSRTPMSISAETQGTLDSLGIKTSQDLTRIVPGLRIESNGAAGTVSRSAVSARPTAQRLPASIWGMRLCRRVRSEARSTAGEPFCPRCSIYSAWRC